MNESSEAAGHSGAPGRDAGRGPHADNGSRDGLRRHNNPTTPLLTRSHVPGSGAHADAADFGSA